jgi:hypothetical protein
MAKPNHGTIFVLLQLCKQTPPHLVQKLAHKYGCDRHANLFTLEPCVRHAGRPTQSFALSLKDLCDDLRMQSGKPITVRMATPPAQNTLSHANKRRDTKTSRRVVLERAKTTSVATQGRRIQPLRPCCFPSPTGY